jgi:hypothetical protein
MGRSQFSFGFLPVPLNYLRSTPVSPRLSPGYTFDRSFFMSTRNDLAHGEPVQTEFAWAEAPRVDSALQEPAQSKVSDPIAVTDAPASVTESPAPSPVAECSAPAAAAPATPNAEPKRPVSERRLAANRANAQKSTGPRTPEGKRRSALNATRHGILSQVLHFPEEELEAYTEFTSG